EVGDIRPAPRGRFGETGPPDRDTPGQRSGRQGKTGGTHVGTPQLPGLSWVGSLTPRSVQQLRLGRTGPATRCAGRCDRTPLARFVAGVRGRGAWPRRRAYLDLQ